MPKYTDTYQNVKNLAPVANCLKGQQGRSEQSTLQWQFGLRAYSQGVKECRPDQTNFAQKPEKDDSERGDPMDYMVPLPDGGYQLLSYIEKKKDDGEGIRSDRSKPYEDAVILTDDQQNSRNSQLATTPTQTHEGNSASQTERQPAIEKIIRDRGSDMNSARLGIFIQVEDEDKSD